MKYDWQELERDQVATDWLLERGYSPELVHKMMRVGVLEEAFNEVRELCEACSDMGTRQFYADGATYYWLCDRVDEAHALRHYAGQPIAQDALRAWLDTPAPMLCSCVSAQHADDNCPICEGSGWFIPTGNK